MFAEKQRSELMELIEKNKDFRPTPIIPGSVPTTVGGGIAAIVRRGLIDFVKSANIFYDPCNLMITSSFGTFWHRNPYCQPPAPSLPPPENSPVIVPNIICQGGLATLCILLPIYQEYSIIGAAAGVGPVESKDAYYIHKQSVSLVSVNYPVEFTTPPNEPNYPQIIVGARITLSVSKTLRLNKVIDTTATYLAGAKEDYEETFEYTYDVWDFSKDSEYNNQSLLNLRRPTVYGVDMGYRFNTTLRQFGVFDRAGEAIFGSDEARLRWERDLNIQNRRETVAYGTGTITQVNLYQIFSVCSNLNPPIPPPKKEDCDCMGCCPDVSNQDALLRLILKRIGSLPASVPDNFAKQSPSMINVESLAELMLWQMEQLDALAGAYPIEIEIEDSDLVQAGNQKQKVSLPNQAEALAELIGMMLTIKRDTHANLITSIKAMGEAGMSKQLTVKVLDVALANAEYLGYKLEQKKKEIPSLFTPGGKDITETLKEKNIEIITYENTDKKDLQTDLKTLLEMAARWNAQNWRRVGGNTAKDLLHHLLTKPEEVAKATKVNDQNDFNDFTEQVERGFIDVTGTTTDAQPWGRPYKERPKVRELKNENGRYGKDEK